MDYSISLRRHWWFDAGIAGLYAISRSGDERLGKFDVSVEVDGDNQALKFKGSDLDELRSYLKVCYEILAERYWNVSTIKQKENPELVVYDREKDQLLLMPKRNPTPVAGLSVKKQDGAHILYSQIPKELKIRVDNFLKENNKKLFGSKENKLMYEQPICNPKLKYIIPVKNKKGKYEYCCVCGQKAQFSEEIDQTSYLLFASSNAFKSFNSCAKKPPAICWECDFISKFAIESASYMQYESKGGNSKKKTTLIIQATSLDVDKLIEMQKEFGSLSSLRMMEDKYFYSNIGHEAESLIRLCRGSYELLWAFMEEKFNYLFKESSKDNTVFDDLIFENILFGFIKKLVDVPVQINLMHVVESGKTFFTKNLIIYEELGYFYRLIYHLKKCDVNTKSLFKDLYMENKNIKNNDNGCNNIFREKILRNALKKNSVLKLIEQLSFTKVMTEERISMSNILRFTIEYEQIIRGDEMNKEQIETAVNLGKQIVIQAVEKGKAENESEKQVLKKIKGDLYQLRKSRTRSDFLSQLNNLQFRYGIAVSKNILEGMLEEVDFDDFRAYCVLGSLNMYNTKNKEKED